ncbi:MAG: rRNA adenine N-6-methyltransferase family protein, partial [Acutalibacteraceae bacterium]|nr:rRNA adenine N-6-methyltransferase family protein [Acutalibacteraceae bacterium]
GAVTVAVNYYAESEILFSVGRESFMPSPNVDSAVIQLKIRENPPIAVKNEKKFFSLVKACFAQRRKTLLNTVSNTLKIDKNELRNALNQIGLSDTVRGEALTMEQLAALSDLI